VTEHLAPLAGTCIVASLDELLMPHVVATDQADQVSITFTVEGAGVGVDSIGRLFASVYARNLDRAIPRLQALLQSPDPARPG
jgi:hypothetical protein